jgi:hypothetical protein
MTQRHWHKEAAPSTPVFVGNTPLLPTPKGLKVVIEVTSYHQGAKVAVATSIVEGNNQSRTIRQHESLMFNDINEAKDAVDALLDRVEYEAKNS